LNKLNDIAKYQNKPYSRKKFIYYFYLTYIDFDSILFIFLYKIELLSSNLLKQLTENCYNQCSFGNRVSTQHYIVHAPIANLKLL